jgi:hypothetical protein
MSHVQLTGPWTAIADNLKYHKLRGGELLETEEHILVTLQPTKKGHVSVQFDIHRNLVDVSDTIKVPETVQVTPCIFSQKLYTNNPALAI